MMEYYKLKKYYDWLDIIKEQVTDDMFETLVLDMIFDCIFDDYDVKVLGCDTTFDNIKIYTLIIKFMSKEVYLVINPDCKTLDENLFPDDKYMIANKDRATLASLLNHINHCSYDDVPDNIKWLIPVLSDFNKEELKKIANFYCYSALKNFYKFHGVLSENHSEYYEKLKKLFYKAEDYTIEKLIEEKYMNSKKDWNKTTGEIKLTGEKGGNLTCYCSSPTENYVNFIVLKPCNPFQVFLTPKSNIERFAEEIVTIIKAVKEDRRILCEISE